MDRISSLQASLEQLSHEFYTVIGVLQNDAPPVDIAGFPVTQSNGTRPSCPRWFSDPSPTAGIAGAEQSVRGMANPCWRGFADALFPFNQSAR